MMASLPDLGLAHPNQAELDWFIRQGASVQALVQPVAMMIAIGSKAADGRFEPTTGGERWLAFEQEDDIVLWQPRHRLLESFDKRAFALGEGIITKRSKWA